MTGRAGENWSREEAAERCVCARRKGAAVGGAACAAAQGRRPTGPAARAETPPGGPAHLARLLSPARDCTSSFEPSPRLALPPPEETRSGGPSCCRRREMTSRQGPASAELCRLAAAAAVAGARGLPPVLPPPASSTTSVVTLARTSSWADVRFCSPAPDRDGSEPSALKPLCAPCAGARQPLQLQLDDERDSLWPLSAAGSDTCRPSTPRPPLELPAACC